MVKNLMLWAVIAVVLMTVFNNFAPRPESPAKLSYSEFIKQVHLSNVKSVLISPDNHHIQGKYHSGETFETNSPDDPGLIKDLFDNNVDVGAGETKSRSLLLDVLIS